MTKTLIVIAAFLTLSVPAALAVPPAGKGKPEKSQASSQGAEKNAAKACKAERAKDSTAFKTKYGKNPNKANAFGKCVSMKAKKAKEEEESEQREAKENAAKKCKAERGTTAESIAKFKETYAPNHPNGANAFGKCVSKLAKQKSS